MLNKKILISGLVVLIILVAGIFVVVKKKNNVAVPINKTSQIDVEKTKRATELNNLNQELIKVRLTDKDLDGLTDAEEVKLGTNPNSSDTDSDSLMDNDEIKIYKTNPLKADTDGDGKSDGYEVRRGTDPLKK